MESKKLENQEEKRMELGRIANLIVRKRRGKIMMNKSKLKFKKKGYF